MVLYQASDFPHTPANLSEPSIICNSRNIWCDANGPQLCLPLKVPAIADPYDFNNYFLDVAYDASAILELADEAILDFRGRLEEMLTLEIYPDELRVTCIVMMAQQARYNLDMCHLDHLNPLLFWAFIRDSLITFPCVEGLGLQPVMQPFHVPATHDLPPGATELRICQRSAGELVSSVAVYRGGDEKSERHRRTKKKEREDKGERAHRTDKDDRRESRDRTRKSERSQRER